MHSTETHEFASYINKNVIVPARSFSMHFFIVQCGAFGAVDDQIMPKILVNFESIS